MLERRTNREAPQNAVAWNDGDREQSGHAPEKRAARHGLCQFMHDDLCVLRSESFPYRSTHATRKPFELGASGGARDSSPLGSLTPWLRLRQHHPMTIDPKHP